MSLLGETDVKYYKRTRACAYYLSFSLYQHLLELPSRIQNDMPQLPPEQVEELYQDCLTTISKEKRYTEVFQWKNQST